MKVTVTDTFTDEQRLEIEQQAEAGVELGKNISAAVANEVGELVSKICTETHADPTMVAYSAAVGLAEAMALVLMAAHLLDEDEDTFARRLDAAMKLGRSSALKLKQAAAPQLKEKIAEKLAELRRQMN